MNAIQERPTDQSDFVGKLKSRHREIVGAVERFAGLQNELIDQKVHCISGMEQARNFLDRKEEVRAVLDALHESSVVKVKELYEDLLTGLLKDIFPDDPENDRVQLNLQVKRKQSSLSIQVFSKSGYARDVFLDKGGSVKSVIAIGLRFIALARSPRRRLVVLDEADSALDAGHIPRFAKMMEQLSSQIGMQVIYISHHPHKLFEKHARIIRLSRDSGKVYADCISDKGTQEIVGWEGEKDIGIWMDGAGLVDMRLVNVKQHENTLIEFSPLVNVLIGTVDVGKSTVVQAISAVARNDAREGLIRDDEREMRIELGLEASQRLVYRHRRTGSKKTAYRLYDHNNEPVKKSDDGKNVPDWLHTVLGMELYRGFDLHIGMQGSTEFLLDPRYSDFKRAEILSFSKFSGGAQRMIVRHQQKVDSNQKKLTELKKSLSAVKHRLSYVSLASEAWENIRAFEANMEQIEKLDREIKQINDDISSFQADSALLKSLSKIDDLVLPDREIEQLSELEGVDQMLRDAADLESLERQEAALAPIQRVTVPELPEFDDSLDEMIKEGKEWAALIAEEEALARIKELPEISIPEASVLDEADEIAKGMKEIEALIAEETELKKSAEESKKELTKIESDLKSELAAMGPVCVTCNQPINLESGDHTHV